MNLWPQGPAIYEINTWVWLQELGKGKTAPVTLATVPKKEWDAIAALGVDAVWFMGVWERSPAGIAVSMGNPGLLDDFRRALPDFTAADNVGSPYCVRNYVGRSPSGRPGGAGDRPQGTCQARAAPDPRFRPQPRGPGPSVGDRPPRLLHPGRLRRLGA